MRRKAKEAASQAVAPTRPAVKNSSFKVDLSKVGLNVDPSCFDYEGNARYLRSTCQKGEVEQKSRVGSGEAATAEFVQFFQAHGLSGPLRAYANALVLQGLEDPTALILAESTRLSHALRMAELESTDELLLQSALGALR